MISPGWCCDFSFEGFIACPAYLLLLDSWVVADGCFRSSDHDFVVVVLDIARVEGHVARGEVEPQHEDEVQRGRCILERFLITRYAHWDIDWRSNCIFDVGQELLLSVEPRPGLENVRACLGLRSQDSPHIVRILSLRRSTPVLVKPSDLSGMNIVHAPDMSRLWRSASFGWKNGPSE